MPFLICFLLVFGPRTSTVFDIINITCVGLIAYAFVFQKKIDIKAPKDLLWVFFVYTMLALFNGIRALEVDVWHALQPIKSLINFLGCYIFLKIYLRNKEHNTETLIILLGQIVFIHSCIIILQMLIPELKTIMYSFMNVYDKSPLRGFGLTRSYGITSLVTFLGMVLVFQSKNISLVSRIMQITIIFVSLFFQARIGLYAAILFLCVMMFWYINIKKIVTYTLIFIISVFLISTGSLLFVNNLDKNLIAAFGHSIELYKVLIGENQEFRSFDTMTRFAHYNETYLDYLIGSANYGRGSFLRLNNDISYIHFFSFSGIIGVFCIIYMHMRTIFLRINKDYLFIQICFAIVFLVSNFKEASYFTRNILSLMFLVCLCIYLDYNKKRQIV